MKRLFGNHLVKVFSLLILVVLLIINGLGIENTFPNNSINKNDLPSGEPSSEEVRFAVVGDTGTGGRRQNALAQQMLKMQEKSRFDLLLFLGDNIYESGSPRDVERKFLKPYQGLIQNNVEMRAVLGNHDVRNQRGILLQKMLFGMGANTYYSFDRKNNLIEFFALDSTILVKKEKETEREFQLKWFEKSLAESKAVWKVVFLHHPLYSSAKRHGVGSGSEDKMMDVRELIEPMLIKYKVNLVISGHDHVYEHPQPQAGIHYFISGTGGKLRKGNLETNTSFFHFGNDQVNSFILFSAKPRFIEFWAIDAQGNILENGKISKN